MATNSTSPIELLYIVGLFAHSCALNFNSFNLLLSFLFCTRACVSYYCQASDVIVVSFLRWFCNVTTIFFNILYLKNFFISKFGWYICSSERANVLH